VLEVQDSVADVTDSNKRSVGNVANLKPFQKGVSGNPGGRKKTDDVKLLARKHTVAALNRIVELIHSADERVAIMAAKEVLDRAYGKTKPAEEEDDNAKKNVTINILRYTEPNARDHASAPVEAQAISVRTLALS
jgi:hypothetical protein